MKKKKSSGVSRKRPTKVPVYVLPVETIEVLRERLHARDNELYLSRQDAQRWERLYVQERKEHAEERRELYSRIQMWEAPPSGELKSQLPVEDGTEPAPYTEAELASLGLTENESGGFIHEATGKLYEDVDAFIQMQNWLKSKGLPLNTDPTMIAREEG